MKSLLEKAKPQLLEASAKREARWQATINEYKNQLQEGYYVYKIEYSTAMDLMRWVGEDIGERIESPWHLFETDN